MPMKLEVLWEVSTLSTTAAFCSNRSRQSLYSVVGTILSRYDKFGLSWAHKLGGNKVEPCSWASSICLSSPESALSTDAGAIRNSFVVSLNGMDDIKSYSSYITLDVREHCSKLRNNAIVRVSLESVEVNRLVYLPRFIGAGVSDEFSGEIPYLPSAEIMLPVHTQFCSEESQCLLIVAAHSKFGSTFLCMKESPQLPVTPSKTNKSERSVCVFKVLYLEIFKVTQAPAQATLAAAWTTSETLITLFV